MAFTLEEFNRQFEEKMARDPHIIRKVLADQLRQDCRTGVPGAERLVALLAEGMSPEELVEFYLCCARAESEVIEVARRVLD